MRYTHDDCIKRRLVEPGKIAMAVDYLLASGVAIEMVPVELCRKFYVDIDALNMVLTKTPRCTPTP